MGGRLAVRPDAPHQHPVTIIKEARARGAGLRNPDSRGVAVTAFAADQARSVVPPSPVVGDRGEAVTLAVSRLSKVYPGTKALDGVSFEVRPGEVHALCGGNGSGKSTLVKILSGVEEADSGEVEIAGRRLRADELSPKASYELGFRVVHQDPALYPDLSVAENMMLGGKYPMVGGAKIRWREVRRRAKGLIDEFKIPARPAELIKDLPVSVRTQVAIATALQDVRRGQCVIALDEVTAALPAREAGRVHASVRQLAEMGHAVLFVSHRLDEVLALADRVTVLRDGRVFREHDAKQLTEEELIEAIVGRRAEDLQVQGADRSIGEPVLELRGLRAGPLTDVSLHVSAGEILGLAGLLASGRTELLAAIYGGLRSQSGQVVLRGRQVRFRAMKQAIDAGVILVPGDRPREGAFLDMTLDENIDISVLSDYWRGLRFRRRNMRGDARGLRERFRIKAPSGVVPMKTLSGGNQQKAILARWLRRDACLLLLDQPTQGVDVGARADIYTAIRAVTSSGGAAIAVVDDLEELATFADRAVVIGDGRVTAEVPPHEMSAQRLNELVHLRKESST
jgi:ribose transport system ATP-binding protein